MKGVFAGVDKNGNMARIIEEKTEDLADEIRN